MMSFFLAVLFSSCAVFNASHRLTIRTNLPAKTVIVDGNEQPIKNGSVKLQVKRDRKPLMIYLKTADSTYQFSFRNRNSFNYIVDGIITGGIAWLIEKNSPRRYYYQKNIYLEQKNDAVKISRFPPTPKGSIKINLSFPYANYLYTKTTTGYIHKAGFLGLGTGVDLFYKQNRSVSFNAGAAIDNGVPFPVGIDYFGNYKLARANSIYVNLRNNYLLGSFGFGYGLSASRYTWNEFDNRGSTPIETTKHTITPGLSLATDYRVTKNFRLGLLYQPSVFRFEEGIKPCYQHLLSLELIFRFAVKDDY